MSAWRKHVFWCLVSTSVFGLFVTAGIFVTGCGAEPALTGGGDGGSTPDLGYGGAVSGTVSASISSADAGAAKATAKAVADLPPAAAENATVSFKDLDGNPLKDAAGNEYPPVGLNPDNSFEATGLPVGVDFVIEVDLDGNGTADMSHIISIPVGEDGRTGRVDDIDVNPLTTMAVAKLMNVIETKGVSADDLDFSPAAVIDQIITGFSTLFEAMGIDSTITIDQIMSKTIDALAEAFDELVPDSVKTTMDMATSKVDLADAETPEDLVLAVIPVLLRAGIAVADEPGGTVLDSVADLPNVEVVTWEQMSGPQPPPGEGPPPPDAPEILGEENRIFRSTVVEVDRNFAAMDDEQIADHGPDMRLIIRKHDLERMAGLVMQGKTLSLRDLYRLATDLGMGMGMRLTYGVPMPPPPPGEQFDPGPPPMMFQSADQRGVQVDMQALEEQIRAIASQRPVSDAQRDSQVAAIRAVIQSALADTQAPTMEQLFGGIISDEPVTVESLSAKIRNARSHLPFNWSGEPKLYVLADRDRFRYADALRVTVDVQFDQDGRLAKVTYNSEQQGKYYLRTFGDPEHGYMAELILAATGRTVFDKTGWPVQADLSDQTIFEPVIDKATGQTVSFLDAFSETGEFWPIEPALTVPNPWYDPERAADPSTNPPTVTIHVMVTEPGPEGQIVTVSVAEDGAVVRDPSGNYALEMFWEGPPVDAMMAVLTDVRTGQRLHRDPNDPGSEEFRVLPEQIVDLEVAPEQFTHIFDIDVPNPRYNPQGDPWYDDINDNGQWDADEPTFSHKEELWQAGDWRSTNVEIYYRRGDNNKPVQQRDVDFQSPTPQTFTGVPLVPRNFKRRNNAFTFGRPNSAISLLTTFLSKDFFDGTHKLNADTRLDPFGALAIMNLIFDARLYNLEAYVTDYGPEGPRPATLQIVEAHPWVPPIDDPVILMIKGFEELATAP